MGSDERLDPKRSRNPRPTRTEAIDTMKQQKDTKNLGALKAVLFANTT